MTREFIIRNAKKADHTFILGQSRNLAETACLDWHSDSALNEMQDSYISEMLEETTVPHITLIAEKDGNLLGFIHARSHRDSISEELCGTVPLLSVSPAAQGLGVGRKLLNEVEKWASKQGYGLLHLEVFANNTKALRFYEHIGFQRETLHMVKTVERVNRIKSRRVDTK